MKSPEYRTAAAAPVFEQLFQGTFQLSFFFERLGKVGVLMPAQSPPDESESLTRSGKHSMTGRIAGRLAVSLRRVSVAVRSGITHVADDNVGDFPVAPGSTASFSVEGR